MRNVQGASVTAAQCFREDRCALNKCRRMLIAEDVDAISLSISVCDSFLFRLNDSPRGIINTDANSSQRSHHRGPFISPRSPAVSEKETFWHVIRTAGKEKICGGALARRINCPLKIPRQHACINTSRIVEPQGRSGISNGRAMPAFLQQMRRLG